MLKTYFMQFAATGGIVRVSGLVNFQVHHNKNEDKNIPR